MKKRVLLIGLVVGVCGFLAFFGYAFRASLRKPAAYHQMASLFPARPLAYIQCTQLAARLKDFSQRPSYQALLQSPLFDQIRTAPWWQDLSSSLQNSFKGMPIDPVRLIGTDTAIGVYQAEEGEFTPGVLIVTKIDLLVTLVERFLYFMNSISGALNIQKQGEIDGIPVYELQQEEMIVSIYYSIIGDLGILSTSLPLLRHTLLHASGKSADAATVQVEEYQSQYPFEYIIDTSKSERFVIVYWDASKILHELQQYEVFDPQGVFDETLLTSLGALPLVHLAVDAYAHTLVVSLDLIFPALPPEKSRPIQEDDHENTLAVLTRNTPAQYPLLAAVNRMELGSLFSTLDQLFPQQSWRETVRWQRQQSLIWGEYVECRLGTDLFGTVYPMPDVACILDTRHPLRARAMLDYSIQMVFDYLFPSTIQRRTMASTAVESYHDSEISSFRVVFQEVYAYAVYPPSSQPAYTIVATNTQAVKSYLDMLRDPSKQLPFTAIPRILFARNSSRSLTQSLPIGGILIRTMPLLELLEALSKTSTFTRLFPQEIYPRLYHIIPDLRQSEAALPDTILFSIQVQEAESFSIRLLFRKS